MLTRNIDPILPNTKAELYFLLTEGQNRGTNRSIHRVKSDCLRPLPIDYISFKPVFKKGTKQGEVPYIDWCDCLLILDYICPDYSYQVGESQIGNRAVVKGQLTLHCKERDYIIESLGNEDIDDIEFGGAIADASAQALRRCLATLGLGRYLYYPSDRPTKVEERHGDAERGDAEKISQSQLKRLYAIAGSNNIKSADAKRVIAEFGYESGKDILKKDYNAIVARLVDIAKYKSVV